MQNVEKLNEYQVLAQRTANLTDKGTKLINAALGLCGESGEFADMVKKHNYQSNKDHVFDRIHAIKELGDIMWYIAEAAEALDTTMEDIASMNIEKLAKRYKAGFTVAESEHRAEGDI